MVLSNYLLKWLLFFVPNQFKIQVDYHMDQVEPQNLPQIRNLMDYQLYHELTLVDTLVWSHL